MRLFLALCVVTACRSDKPAPGTDKPAPAPAPAPADAAPDARVVAPKTAPATLACPAGTTQIVGSRAGTSDVRVTLIECRVSAHGARNGPYVSYDEDGNLEQQGMYANDKLDGSFTEYRNGVKYQIGTYARGTMSGTWTNFYPDGKRNCVSERENDKTVAMTCYSEAGRLTARGKSPDGLNDGLWEWFDDGKPRSAELYKNGEGIAFWVWKHGVKTKVTEDEFDKAANAK